MNIIARTFAIVAAALVIVAITFGLAETSYAQDLFPSRERPQVAAQATTNATASVDSTTAQSRPAGEGDQGASLFGIVEVVKNLVIIAVITGVVSLVKRVLPKGKPKGKVGRPNAPPLMS